MASSPTGTFPLLQRHLNILSSAAGNILRHSLRSVVVVLCLVAVLLPFISAVAIQEGVRDQSLAAVQEGADVYVTMDMFGRNGIVPIAAAQEFQKVNGVVRAVPRVISRIYLGERLAVLLGIPSGGAPAGISITLLEGRLPKPGEIVIGKRLAENLGLKTGGELGIGVRIIAIIDHKPQILREMYRVSGVFDTRSGIWSTDLVLMDIEDAAAVFDLDGLATDIAVYTSPGQEGAVAEAIQKMNAAFRIQTKGLVETYMERGFGLKGGVFAALYTVAFALAVPALLVSSGFGLSDRRREVGVMKAAGWETAEVLEMVFFENVFLAIIGAVSAFLLAVLWIRGLNGFFIAQLFVAGAGTVPPFPVPARFLPLPLVISLFFGLVLTLAGSLYPVWRTATIPPAEALR